MPPDARIQLTITDGSVGANAIKVPPAGRITLSAEARLRLVRSLTSDLDYLNRHLDDEDDTVWAGIEDALLEIFMPARYITGVPTSEDLLERRQAINPDYRPLTTGPGSTVITSERTGYPWD